MTEKQENILNTALKLFATKGYTNTSTSLIAREAGVSEGLIFRHFGSKDKLLDELVNLGICDMEKAIAPLIEEVDPNKILSDILDFILHVVRNDLEKWQLQMTLKYQSPEIAKKYHSSKVIMQMNEIIENAFRKLNYPNPKAETKLFMLIIGALFTILPNEDEIDQESFINFIKSKYNI